MQTVQQGSKREKSDANIAYLRPLHYIHLQTGSHANEYTSGSDPNLEICQRVWSLCPLATAKFESTLMLLIVDFHFLGRESRGTQITGLDISK